MVVCLTQAQLANCAASDGHWRQRWHHQTCIWRTQSPGLPNLVIQKAQRVKQLVPENVWRQRYHLINEFEHMLTLNNITVIKFFLHISKDEQKQRLESRLEDPDKHWKFSSNDLKERLLWDDYQAAFEEMINNCSTAHAPWYVVPANNKLYRNLVVARTIADTLSAMNPQYQTAEKGLENIVVPD